MFSPLLRKEGQTVTLDLISYGRTEDFQFKMRGSLLDLPQVELNACSRINYVIIGYRNFLVLWTEDTRTQILTSRAYTALPPPVVQAVQVAICIKTPREGDQFKLYYLERRQKRLRSS